MIFLRESIPNGENRNRKRIKLSWTGSPTNADGVVRRNYEVIDKFANQQRCSKKKKYLSKYKTLQKKADRR